MNNRQQLRQLDYLLGLDFNLIPIYVFNFEDVKKSKDKLIKSCEEVISEGEKKCGKKYLESCVNTLKIFNLSSKLGLSYEDLMHRKRLLCYARISRKNVYKLAPLKEGRDNKGVYVGNGGSNRNKVRYPSKKRSKKTWKIFYQMFPKLAEQDGWDGNTSKRMN